MFVFLSSDNILYTNPDSFICDQKHETVEWGTELKIYPVYKKGKNILTGYQTIKCMFTHEGKTGSCHDTVWVTDGNYFSLNNQLIDIDKIIRFDKLGNKHPIYYYSLDDLMWYIKNIYTHDTCFVN